MNGSEAHNTTPRTQRIIIDNNTYSNKLLHTALCYAEAAHHCNFAEIKLLFTPMLLAEIHHTQMLHTPPRRSDPNGKANPIFPAVTLSELVEGYGDYIEITHGDSTEKRVKTLMWEHLTNVLEEDPVEFYRMTGQTTTSMPNPEKDLNKLLNTTEGFVNCYHECLRHTDFRDSLMATNPGQAPELGPTKDLADHSVVEWYQDHLTRPKTDNDLILVSCDQGLLSRLKHTHNKAYPHTRNLDHFEHFDQTAFARHALEDLRAMCMQDHGVHYRNESIRGTVDACMDMCKFLIRTKKPGMPYYNEDLMPIHR